MPTGPVIAVLPFANLSGDPDQEYFADGLSEEIITALTHFDEVFILARNTTFRFKGQAVDVTRVGQELGAHYVLEGSVQRAASRVRVTAQLLDAEAGTHLWAENYERHLTTTNIFDVMNDITSRVVGAIADAQGVITRAEGRRARLIAPDDLAAYDCVLKAHAYWAVFTRDLHAEVRACLKGAVEREPSYAEAWAWLSMLTIDEYRLGFNPQPNPRRRTTAAAREAVRLAPDSEVAYQALAYSLFYDNDLDGFFVAAERALELNPNNAQVVASLGLHFVYAGKSERGLALLRKAAVLNPQHLGWYYFPSMYYYYGRGEYERALTESKKLEQTDVFWAPAWIAAIYGQLGRGVEARSATAELLRMNPAFPSTVREEYLKWFKWPPEQLDLFLEGLSKAGLEIPPEKTGPDIPRARLPKATRQ
jgi:TolB-like protein